MMRLLTIAAVLALAAGHVHAAGGDLIAAVKSRDVRAVQALLHQRTDPNAAETDGTTALHWAVQGDDLKTAELLITSGANAKATTRYGVTPLHLAVLGNHPEVVRALLAAGADPGIRDTEHDSDALGWAKFFLQHRGDTAEKRRRGQEIVDFLEATPRSRPARR